MTYSITNTSGSNSYIVTDGYINNDDLDIILVGRGYTSYGSFLNQNFLKLLENFSNSSEPSKPITGQLWYDSLNGRLEIYNGSNFVSVLENSSIDELTIGDLLFANTTILGLATNSNVNIIPNGTGFTVLNRLGVAGAQTTKMLYTAANGMVQSSGATYTAASDTITVTSVNATNFAGAITTASQPAITTVGNLTSLSVAGNINAYSNVSVTGNVTAGNLKTSGSVYSDRYYYSNGLSFVSSLYSNANVSAYLPTYTGSIGTSGTITMNNLTVTGTANLTASSAKYADLAELYESDNNYEAGTVVDFGGEFEITLSSLESKKVAGVISTNPAYLMNSQAIGNFMLPVALTGRTPCMIKGPVSKGDLLVSAGDGYAMTNNDPKVGTVIGKALADFNGEIGTIEIVVGRY